MREKLLLLVFALILLISVPTVAAAVASSERIHVNGTFTYSPNRGFTLWFTNGTILSNHLNGFQIPVSDSPTPTQWTFSFTVTNDNNAPITITATTTNAVALPQNIISTFTCKATNNQTSTTIAAGGKETLQLSGDFHTNGAYTPGASFNYAIQVTVISNASSFGSTFGVYGVAQYPTAPSPTSTPQPTPTVTSGASPTPTTTSPPQTTPTSNPSTQPTSDPTDTPTTNPSTSPTPSDTGTIPELNWIAVVLALLILLPATAVVFRRCVKSKAGVFRVASVALALAMVLAALFINLSITPPAEAQQQKSPQVSFSLWFVNGTAFPLNINSGTFQYGNPQLNIGGIIVSPSAYGSQFMPETNLIVLRNDGNTPITVTTALENVNTPANIEVSLHRETLGLSWAPIGTQWMGYDNLATGDTVAPGQCMWLGLTLVIAQSNNAPSGTPTFGFTYSFDIVVTASQG